MISLGIIVVSLYMIIISTDKIKKISFAWNLVSGLLMTGYAIDPLVDWQVSSIELLLLFQFTALFTAIIPFEWVSLSLIKMGSTLMSTQIPKIHFYLIYVLTFIRGIFTLILYALMVGEKEYIYIVVLVFIYLNSAFIIIISMVIQTSKITKYLNKHYESIYKSAALESNKVNLDKEKSVLSREALERAKLRLTLPSTMQSSIQNSVIQFPSNPTSPRNLVPLQITIDSTVNTTGSPTSNSNDTNVRLSSSFSETPHQVINEVTSPSFTNVDYHKRNLSVDSCLPITNEDSIKLDQQSFKNKDNDETGSRRLTVPSNIFSQMTKNTIEEDNNIIKTTYISIKRATTNNIGRSVSNKVSPENLYGNTTMIASKNSIIMQTTSLISPKDKRSSGILKNDTSLKMFNSERGRCSSGSQTPVSTIQHNLIKVLSKGKSSNSNNLKGYLETKSNKDKHEIKISISESYKDTIIIINKTKRKLLLLVLYLALLITAGSIYFIFEVISYAEKAEHTELNTFNSSTHAPYYYMVGMIVVIILNLISLSYNFRKIKH
jgi:hypothetical protein